MIFFLIIAMSIVEPIWIEAKRERSQFFNKELNNYFDALEAQAPTYDIFDEVGLGFPQFVPDPVLPPVRKYKNEQYQKALDNLNSRGDEWDRLHPEDKCKRCPLKK